MKIQCILKALGLSLNVFLLVLLSCHGAVAASPSGATITGPGATLTDASGGVWQLVYTSDKLQQTIQLNDAAAGYSAKVIQLVYFDGKIYQENWVHRWWVWVGNGAWTEVTSSIAPINGACSPNVAGQSFDSAPTGTLCSAGLATALTGSGPWNWTCQGIFSGASQSCSVSKYAPVNGACNTDIDGKSLAALPATGLCAVGTAVNVSGSGPWTWSCAGAHSGTDASCSAHASCTMPNGKVNENGYAWWWPAAPAVTTRDATTAECVDGGAATVSTPQEKKMTCTEGVVTDTKERRDNASLTPTVTAVCKVKGVCGAADGVAVDLAPTSGLCAVGTASVVTGSGPWSWTCTGADGGADVSCTAPKIPPVDGACNADLNGRSLASLPASGVCAVGATSSISGSGPWSWSCAGAHGGADASCSAHASCVIMPSGRINENGSVWWWPALASTTTRAATSAECPDGGTATVSTPQEKKMTCAEGVVIDTTERRATVAATPTVTLSCRVNSACGEADHSITATAPTTGFCRGGATPAHYTAYPTEWSWECPGTDGGDTATCKAFATTHACLPFVPPSSTALFASNRRVFGHYFYPFLLSKDNLPAPIDWYNTKAMNSNFVASPPNTNYKPMGGYFRQRPIVVPTGLSGYALANAKREVRLAIARGITGFSPAIMNVSQVADPYSEISTLIQAIKEVDPRFKILTMPDMNALWKKADGVTSVVDDNVVTIIRYMAASPVAYKLAGGEIVVAPYHADYNMTPDRWRTIINRLQTEGIKVAFMPVFLGTAYSANFADLGYGYSYWGSSTPKQQRRILGEPDIAHTAKKVFMTPVRMQDYRPKGGDDLWEA